MKLFILSLLCVFALFYVIEGQACIQPTCQSCGNGKCEVGETSCSCPGDCAGCCPDGSCRPDRGENHLNCPSDCAVDVVVKVVDADTGAPLPASTVTCYSQHEVVGPSMTGADSSVTFPGQPEEVWTCRAEKEGYNPNSGSGHVVHPFKCVGSQVIVIPLKYRDACLLGEVTDCFTKMPIVGSLVVCRSIISTSSLPSKLTDLEGRFFYDHATKGAWNCTATATGYIPGSRVVPYDYDEAQTHRICLRQIPGGVNGTVFDSKNFTLLTAGISCVDVEGKVYKLDNSANFTWMGLHPGPVKCSAEKDFFYPATDAGVVRSGAIVTLRLPLVEFNGDLCGRVIDGYTGNPIHAARVHCEHSCGIDEGFDLTDAGGNYCMRGLKQGSYMCMVTHAGFQDGWDNKIVIANDTRYGCAPNRNIGENVVVHLNFTLLPIESVVIGKVFEYVNVPGAPIAGANVTCWDRVTNQRATNVSNAEGDYRIGWIYGFGELICRATAPGYQVSGRAVPYTWEGKYVQDISMVKV